MTRIRAALGVLIENHGTLREDIKSFQDAVANLEDDFKRERSAWVSSRRGLAMKLRCHITKKRSGGVELYADDDESVRRTPSSLAAKVSGVSESVLVPVKGHAFGTDQTVRLCQLRSNTEYNGKVATVRKFVEKDGLYIVDISDGAHVVDSIAIRPSNICKMGEFEKMKTKTSPKKTATKKRRSSPRWRTSSSSRQAELEKLHSMGLVRKHLDLKTYGKAHYVC
eukprot:g3257.t1